MAIEAVPLGGGRQAGRSWTGLLVPSLSDVFLSMLVWWSFAASPEGWQRLLGDSDTGFHIRVGDWILAHRAVPREHLFSFAIPGGHWYAFEWLSETWFAWLHASWGLNGVAFFAGLAIAASLALVVVAAAGRGATGLPALAVGLIGANAASSHFHARPHVFTLLFLAVAVTVVDRDRRQPTRWLWTLVPLALLWANLHAGFLIFFFYLAIVIVAERRVRHIALGAACVGASLVNPYGWRLHAHLLEVARARWYYELVDEFRAPDFRSEAHLNFLLLLFLGLALLWPLLRDRQFADALLVVAFGYSAMMAVRNIPIFVIVAGPIVAAGLSRVFSGWAGGRPRTSVARILEDVSLKAGAGLRMPGPWSVVCAGLIILPAASKPLDFPADRFPASLVAAHASELASARVFSSDQWANYLIYRNYPRQQVFIDSQHHGYGPVILGEALGIMSGRRDWSQLLDRYRIGMVLCPADSALATLLRESRSWTVVAEDRGALLARAGARPGP